MGETIKNKSGLTVKYAFEEIFKESNRKPRKLFVDKGSEFYNKNVKPSFESDESHRQGSVYSTENAGKSVVIERFNRTLKSKLFKKFTEQGNQKWLKILPGIVDQYNNKVHSGIEETPKNVSDDPYLIRKKIFENNYSNESNPNLQKRKPKFKIGDRVRIFRYRNKFEKGFIGYWTKEIFEVCKINQIIRLLMK